MTLSAGTVFHIDRGGRCLERSAFVLKVITIVVCKSRVNPTRADLAPAWERALHTVLSLGVHPAGANSRSASAAFGIPGKPRREFSNPSAHPHRAFHTLSQMMPAEIGTAVQSTLLTFLPPHFPGFPQIRRQKAEPAVSIRLPHPRSPRATAGGCGRRALRVFAAVPAAGGRWRGCERAMDKFGNSVTGLSESLEKHLKRVQIAAWSEILPFICRRIDRVGMVLPIQRKPERRHPPSCGRRRRIWRATCGNSWPSWCAAGFRTRGRSAS
ncbi:protein of unknown function (plasmid) [Azospirillum lipoferum 4B]|uniref:Uncharacterized protein n=1 Tax=Azospirillum lipoferum (strain 4B) TaxID=862719 RepID=G7ZB10_AZOL4|nr:protein of unknown function [Azospirillum lipoferum 4B]